MSEEITTLNVGGTLHSTLRSTLCSDPQSTLAKYFSGNDQTTIVGIRSLADGSHFIDRDGELFRFILGYLRDGKLILPERFNQIDRLRQEAAFYNIQGLIKALPNHRKDSSMDQECDGGEEGHITLGYRGTFAFGRDGQADVKFRKLNRIIICGKSSLCREVFGDTLNESRDPDRTGENRYTARLYLKHNSLEAAFDVLAEKGFRMIGSCGSGASGGASSSPIMTPSQDLAQQRAGADSGEEARWNHYNEFIFARYSQ